jgi:hypothetical protein
VALIAPPIGFILGAVSVTTAHRDGRNASGLAVAGVILGGLATIIILIVIVKIAGSAASDPTQQYINCINSQLDNPQVYCTPPSGG